MAYMWITATQSLTLNYLSEQFSEYQNHSYLSDQSEQRLILSLANENSKGKQADSLKREWPRRDCF